MKLGSLFDGSGGFPLAAQRAGIIPAWASEIEPYPIAVTRRHFPEMTHLGDVSKIDGAKIEPVDVITFGSPCQDMSMAGKREGLRGERSGLFFDAVRIIKEIRAATNGEYPRYAIWENVLGSITSNDGRDFGCVLNELLAVVDQNPVVRPNDRWRKNGAICGDAFSLAWRVLDAQYWGVPQRRKRVFVVCDFRSQSAPAILFKAVDVSVLPAESGEGRNGTAPDVERSADVAVFENHGNAGRYRQEKKACQSLTKELGTGGNNAPLVVTVNPRDRWNRSDVNISGTFTKKGGGSAPIVCLSPSRQDCIADENVSPTLIKDSGCPNLVSYETQKNAPRVRFLTSSECAKLQGFPEDWGGIKRIDESEFSFWRNVYDECARIMGKKPRTDAQVKKWMASPYRESKEYETWGNGVALPCVQYIMDNIATIGGTET